MRGALSTSKPPLIPSSSSLNLLHTQHHHHTKQTASIICVVVPAQYYFGWCIIRNKIANQPNVIERYSVVQELLPAMKLVKYYAWERHFEGEVCVGDNNGDLILLVFFRL